MCTQNLKLLDYKIGRLKASRLLPDMQLHAYGCESLSREEGTEQQKTFAKQSKFNTRFSAEKGNKLFEEKLRRISDCAKYLYVEKLAAGFLREVKGNTNCITIATVRLILLLPLDFLINP